MTFKIQEKRKNPRAESAFHVEYAQFTAKTYTDTVCKDLSFGGVKIVTENALKIGAPMKINIDMIDKIIPADAKVAWCSKEQAINRYSTGLEITRITEADKKELVRFLGKIFHS